MQNTYRYKIQFFLILILNNNNLNTFRCSNASCIWTLKGVCSLNKYSTVSYQQYFKPSEKKKKKEKIRFWTYLCDFKCRLAEIIHSFIKIHQNYVFLKGLRKAAMVRIIKWECFVRTVQHTQGKGSGTCYEGSKCRRPKNKTTHRCYKNKGLSNLLEGSYC